MEVFCLGNKPWQPCYVMRMNHTTIMLDCSLDLPVLLNFLPLPLVYSPKLSGLPRWQCKDPSIAVDLPEDIARLFRENVGHVFIESLPLFRLPETGLVDLSTVDALLLSNCFSALALPFLIEKYGFSGKIFATKPTVTFTKQLMEELSHYIYRAPPTDHSAQWKNDSLWSSLPDGTLKESSDFHNWKELYTMEGIQKAISRIQPISYSETIDLFHHVKVTALSSGFCLGSCNWIIETEYNKVSPSSCEQYTHTVSWISVIMGLSSGLSLSTLQQYAHTHS
ncbi:Integrator complex subunit 9 [Geodia barretti]|uniref:Integrator complex subunit 9 n=1 Tax=Geodia barretti TaxID=519541 RepID=A0AA35SUU0_GEOBA|nr:Integrator complex subunit 9 [Geodia barretti]